MKKFIYIVLLSISASLIVSCTEENVTPKTEAGTGILDSGDKGGN